MRYYAYYPGCAMESEGVPIEKSLVAVCKVLGIELKEIEDWTCCGASAAHVSDVLLPLVLPAKDLLKAEKMGLEVVAPCAACYNRMRQANHKLRENAQLRQKVNQVLRAEYHAQVKVRHISDVVVNEYGLEAIVKQLKNDLKGMKVVCYYGCLSARPQKIVAFDDPVYPSYLDRLIRTLGGEPLEWPFKTECCGGSLLLARVDVVQKLVDDICQAALYAGAMGIVTACPLCMANLDTRQPKTHVPIIHFSELVGIALGAEPKLYNGWLKKHINNPAPVLKELGLI